MRHADVVIIGGGAAGALLLVQLSALASAGLVVAVVDSGPGPLGTGTAYRTADPLHRMNVRASDLSAFPDRPDDFVNWLGPHVRRHDFVPRNQFGTYLNDVVKRGLDTVGSTHVTAGATAITRRRDDVWRVRLDDGTHLAAPSVVLATGVEPPSVAWAPAALRQSPRFVADPWEFGALDRIGPGEPVLIVGTGLTAVDVALTLDGERCITAMSRHGRLPYAHTDTPLPPYPIGDLPTGLAALRSLVRRRLAESIAETGDWRPAIDGLRPVTQQIWCGLSDRERARFIRYDVRHWEAARHRMAPQVAARIEALCASGRLRLARGDARDARVDATTWVINATGPEVDVARTRNRVLRHALATGYAAPGPLGLGLDTTSDGQLRYATGQPAPGLWTLGCLRRGQLWETTAIPEIRAQAVELARRLAGPHR